MLRLYHTNEFIVTGSNTINLVCLAAILGDEITGLLNAATRGESLTYQGIMIGLIVASYGGIVWFARIQFKKEEKLTDKLIEITSDQTKILEEKAKETALVISSNTLELKSLNMRLDRLMDDIARIDQHQQNRFDDRRRTRETSKE